MASPSIWDEDYQCLVHAAHIADPTGGAIVDAQARTAINAILAALRNARIIGRDSTATVEPQTSSAVFDGTKAGYVNATTIADPTGGTPDPELRTAVVQCLTALRAASRVGGTAAGAGPTTFDEDTQSYAYSAYTTPTGGANIDAEGRAQLNLAAAAMRSRGWLTQD